MQRRTFFISAWAGLSQAMAPAALDPAVSPKGPLLNMPEFYGFGTWNLTAGQNGTDAVRSAIGIGYRHIDGATAYGNQDAVGKGIAAALAADKSLKREDLWITTKLWSTRHGDQVSSGTDLNLQQLNLSYVDLTLMHFPVGTVGGKIEYDYVKTWLEMEKLTKPDPKTGVIRSRKIGISNFNVTQLEDLLAHSNVVPYVHQIESHPYLQQQSFVDLHAKHNIKVVAYAPLGNANPEYHYRAAITGKTIEDPTLKSIAKANECASGAQVALAWNMQRGVIVIPRSQHADRQLENYNAHRQCKLSAADMAAIKALDKKARYWDMCCSLGLPCYLGLDGACATYPVAADFCQYGSAPTGTQQARAPYFALDAKQYDKTCPKLPARP